MMKIMLKLISLLFMTFTVNAIPIYSLNTNDGAELECFEHHINLSFFGETYKGTIIISNNLNMLKVVSNFDYYNIPYYVEDSESKIVFTISKTYFIENNKISSAISLDPFYKNDSKEELSMMITALKEAHNDNKCLSWSFDD